MVGEYSEKGKAQIDTARTFTAENGNKITSFFGYSFHSTPFSHSYSHFQFRIMGSM
jgi:hypothetical protein